MKKRISVSLLLLSLLFPLSAFAQKVGGGDITFTPKNAGQVLFSHEKHVSGKGVKCSGCHYQIFQMAQGSYKLDMSKINKGDFCGKCHNGQKSFDVQNKKNCSRCHR